MKKLRKALRFIFRKKKKEKPNYLCELPEVVMREMLKHCDLESIINLRKTCRILRDFISENKPDPPVSRLSVILFNESIMLSFHSSISNIVYYKNGGHVENKIRRRLKTFKKENYQELFLNDIGYILSLKKVALDRFVIVIEDQYENDKTLKKLGVILQNRSPLPVRHIRFEVFDSSHIMPILPYIDCLERIQIVHATSCGIILDLSKISELSQWKSARQVEISNFWLRTPIQVFSGFERVFATMEVLKIEDVLAVKETFLNSPTASLFQFEFGEFVGEHKLHELFGPPMVNDGDNWKFGETEKKNGGFTLKVCSELIRFERC
ncbi:hypothetical protein CRE_23451 [Caenorhabditis remanei]|uniref:F-box domain-containing protein n=1 Tax=Caenorhabditis remanei TaxID=31234 RepID=E3MGT5_CAERE|nr:hypothetical protein CRE_23451 [Caenorhabditis remanei]